MATNKTKVITGVVRLSYANVWEPKSINGSDEKYSVSLIIPKSDKKTIQEIKDAVKSAKQEGKSKFDGKIPANLKHPLKDGDIEKPDEEAYKDSYFVNANSNERPQIVDKSVNPILDQSEVSINFYAFNSDGNKGIACGLGNIQKIRDGEPLSSRSSAADDFINEEEDYFFG